MTSGLGIGGGAAIGRTMRFRHLTLLFLPWIIFVALRAGEVSASAPAAPADGYRGIWFTLGQKPLPDLIPLQNLVPYQ